MATVVAERKPEVLVVEVIGDRWLYGYNYIVRPVFVKRPPMWDVFGRPTYSAWSSPYYYGSWPSYYTKPKPIYLNHYQAYVNTYMKNHQYCHSCDYPTQPFYSGYTQMTESHRRNDYQTAHPDRSFENRVTSAQTSSGVTLRNAGQLRSEVSRQSAAKDTGNSTTQTTTTTTSNRQQTSSGTTQRGSQTTTSTTNTTSASKNTQSSQQRQPSTTVQSRVNKSGTSRTTIKTTDAAGRTSTVKRESSTTTRQSSSRSSGTQSSSRSTETRQSGTSTRR